MAEPDKEHKLTFWWSPAEAWEAYTVSYDRWQSMKAWAKAHPERMDWERRKKLREVEREVGQWQWQWDKFKEYLSQLPDEGEDDAKRGKQRSARNDKPGGGGAVLPGWEGDPGTDF